MQLNKLIVLLLCVHFPASQGSGDHITSSSRGEQCELDDERIHGLPHEQYTWRQGNTPHDSSCLCALQSMACSLHVLFTSLVQNTVCFFGICLEPLYKSLLKAGTEWTWCFRKQERQQVRDKLGYEDVLQVYHWWILVFLVDVLWLLFFSCSVILSSLKLCQCWTLMVWSSGTTGAPWLAEISIVTTKLCSKTPSPVSGTAKPWSKSKYFQANSHSYE